MEIKSFPLDDTYYTASDLRKWFFTRTSGVFSSDQNLKVASNQNMSVEILPGIAFLNDGTGGIVVWKDQKITLSVDPADSILDRIDSVVCRWNKKNNCSEIALVKGIPASNAVAKDPVRDVNAYEIVLAHIHVTAGLSAITQMQIIDMRLDETVCGIMRDGVTGIPTQGLQEQFKEWEESMKDSFQSWSKVQKEAFTKWLDDLKEILDMNVAANHEVRISKLEMICPVGTIHTYAGSTAPEGYFLCQGQSLLKSDYLDLYTVLGTAYGGDEDHFSLPDLRSRIPVGMSNESSFQQLGKTGGELSHTLSSAEMPAHSHIQTAHTHTASSSSSGAHTHSASSGSAGAHTHSISGTAATVANHQHAFNILNAKQEASNYGLAAGGGFVNRVAVYTNAGVAGTATTASGSHAHTVSGTAASAGAHAHSVTVASNGAHTHTLSVANTTAVNGSTGGSGAHNNLQPYITLNYIIKY